MELACDRPPRLPIATAALEVLAPRDAKTVSPADCLHGHTRLRK